jgi:hypothetical protein
MEAGGIEPKGQSSETLMSQDVGTLEGHVLACFLAMIDRSEPELAKLVRSWHSVPPQIRKAIAAMISTIDDNSSTT